LHSPDEKALGFTPRFPVIADALDVDWGNVLGQRKNGLTWKSTASLCDDFKDQHLVQNGTIMQSRQPLAQGNSLG
jgi:hypothetical protein